MSKINYVNGIPLEAEALNKSTEYLEEQIHNQFLSTHTYGVISGQSPKNIVYTDGASLGIYSLTAYDQYGNRIYIPASGEDDFNNPIPTLQGLLPDETGKLINGGNPLPSQSSHILVIRYSTISGEPIAHYSSTGMPVLLGLNDAYELYIRDIGTSIPGDILLAEIYVDANGVISYDESVRKVSGVQKHSVIAVLDPETRDKTANTYTVGSTVSFEDHINAVGTGTVSKTNAHGLSAEDLGIDISATPNHQRLLHSSGLRSDNIDSTDSAMYPSYRRETQTNFEDITISPLSAALNEVLVVNGITIFPENFPTQFSFSMKGFASQSDIGYYIFYYNALTKSIEHGGPYVSETSSAFINVLESANLFPICSFKWDLVYYDETGEGIADSQSFDIIPSTFKDRRVFYNTALKNFRPDEAFALTQFAPVSSDSAHIHNVRLIGTKADTKYNVGNTQLIFTIDDDDTNPVTVSFSSSKPLSIDTIVEQIKSKLVAVDENGVSYLRAYPRVITNNDSNPEDAGKLSISAPNSITINPAGTAAEILGFSAATENISAKSDGLIQEMIYYGERNGIIVFTYNADELITRIDYFLGGGKVRRNIFHYKGEYITRVDEIIESL